MKEWLESHRELVRCAGLGPVAVPMGLVALVLGLMVLAVTEDQVVSMYKASHYVDEQFSRAPGCHPDGGWNSRLVGITACPVSIARPHIDENAVKSPGYMLPGIPLHPGQDGYGFVFDGERDPSEISTVAITVEQYQYRPVASTPPPGGGEEERRLRRPGRRVYRSRGVEIGGGGGEGEQTQAGWLASCESLTHIRKGRRGSCPLDEFFETVDLIPSVVGPPRTEHQKAADGVYQPGSPVKLSSLETCAPAVGGDPAPRRYIYTTKGPASSCTPRPGADLRFSWTAVFLKRGSKRPLPLVSALAEQRPGTLDADGKPVGGFWNVTAALASKDAGAPDEYYLTGWTNQESSAMVVADVRAAAAGGSTSGHVHFLAWLRLRKPGPGVWAFRLAGWLLCWLGVHLVLAGVLDRSGCVPWAAEWAREACRLCCLLGGRRANPQQQYAAVRTSQWQPPPQAAPRYFGLENTSTALLLVYGIAGATFSTLLTIGYAIMPQGICFLTYRTQRRRWAIRGTLSFQRFRRTSRRL
ncbi:hypothetical protein DIPPA_26173 [Diplonema papillatum]|nr:hypothetical protein DIPPA_26173 [Diplonema papillatum]